MRAPCLALLLLALPGLPSSAAEPDAPAPAEAKPAEPPKAAPCPCSDAKPARLEHLVEFTFGTSQLFNRGPGSAVAGSRILPTQAALLLAEYFFNEAWGLAAFLNIPLGSAQVVVNGELVTAVPDSVLAVGGRWAPLRFDIIQKRVRTEIQLSAFVGRTLSFTANDTFLPVVAARVHLHDNGGFAMYVGTSWAFLRESLSLIYGIGYRF